ncbi:MAG: TRAP transporter small permease [Dermatophilus congolensis]|nr:TRAP transporter small permease [Dermatophilus congolensis]
MTMSTALYPPRPFRRINRFVTAFENLAAGLSLIGAVTVALLAIILRTFFDMFLFWSEEVIIYLIISSTFFGSVLTMRSKEHVNVDIISVFLKRRGKRVMAIIAAVITTLYMLAIGILAWMLLFEPFSVDTVTPALKLPLWVVELPVALALTLMFFHGIEEIVYAWRYGADEMSAEDVARAEAAAAGITSEELEASRGKSALNPDEPEHIPGDPMHYIPPEVEHDTHRHTYDVRRDDERDGRDTDGRNDTHGDTTDESGDRR